MNNFDNLNDDAKLLLVEHLDFAGLRALSGVSHNNHRLFSEHRNTRAIYFLNAINTRDWDRVQAMLNADASLRNCKASMTDRHGVEHPSCTPLQLIILNTNRRLRLAVILSSQRTFKLKFNRKWFRRY